MATNNMLYNPVSTLLDSSAYRILPIELRQIITQMGLTHMVEYIQTLTGPQILELLFNDETYIGYIREISPSKIYDFTNTSIVKSNLIESVYMNYHVGTLFLNRTMLQLSRMINNNKFDYFLLIHYIPALINSHNTNLTISFINWCIENSRLYYSSIIQEIFKQNNADMFENVIRFTWNPPSEYGHFYFDTCLSSIFEENDNVEILQKIFQLQSEFNFTFEIDRMFECALLFGRKNCMEVLLSNGIEFYINDEEVDTYIIDEPTHHFLRCAIIGKNIECMQRLYSVYRREITSEDLEKLLLLASQLSTPEILDFLFSLQPDIKTNQLISKLLAYALTTANVNCLIYCQTNGAIFTTELFEMYREVRATRDEDISPTNTYEFDPTLYYELTINNCEDYDEKLDECIRLLQGWFPELDLH